MRDTGDASFCAHVSSRAIPAALHLKTRPVLGVHLRLHAGAGAPAGRSRHPTALQSHPTHRSEEHTSELQSQSNLVCRLLLEKKKNLHWQDPIAIHHALSLAVVEPANLHTSHLRGTT